MATSDLSSLSSIAVWNELQEAERQDVAMVIADLLGTSFRLCGESRRDCHGLRHILFQHLETNITFVLVPGGEFLMGLSETEKMALFESELGNTASGINTSRMEPAHVVRVSPFLCAKFPIMLHQIEERIELEDEPERPVFEDDGEFTPVHLSYSEVTRFVCSLMDKRFRLISEAECEFAMRCGKQTLFPFGDSLGDVAVDFLDEVYFLREYSDPVRCDMSSNDLGIVGFEVGQHCADTWHDTYSGAPSNSDSWVDEECRVTVVRGGAAASWPFQDDVEYLLLMSAMRYRLDEVYKEMSGLRLAISLAKNTAG